MSNHRFKLYDSILKICAGQLDEPHQLASDITHAVEGLAADLIRSTMPNPDEQRAKTADAELHELLNDLVHGPRAGGEVDRVVTALVRLVDERIEQKGKLDAVAKRVQDLDAQHQQKLQELRSNEPVTLDEVFDKSVTLGDVLANRRIGDAPGTVNLSEQQLVQLMGEMREDMQAPEPVDLKPLMHQALALIRHDLELLRMPTNQAADHMARKVGAGELPQGNMPAVTMDELEQLIETLQGNPYAGFYIKPADSWQARELVEFAQRLEGKGADWFAVQRSVPLSDQVEQNISGPDEADAIRRHREAAEDLQSLLGLVMREAPPVEAIMHYTPEEFEWAQSWAGAVHLVASDNADVEVPQRPPFLEGDDGQYETKVDYETGLSRRYPVEGISRTEAEAQSPPADEVRAKLKYKRNDED